MITNFEIVDFAGTPALALTETVAGSAIEARHLVVYDRIAVLAGDSISGPPFAIWHAHRATDRGHEFDMEAGFPTSRPVDGDGEVVPSSLPKCRLVQATHVGNYEHLTSAYEQVMAWMKEHGHLSAGPPWDWYIEDPETTGIDNVKTLICWPIQ